MNIHGKAALGLAGAAAAALALGGCGSSNNNSSSSSTSTPAAGSAKGGTIALLLPESKTTRYESQDKPLFEKKVAAICSNCKVIYSNADQDSSKQQAQAEAAITNGAKVLVLDPVDADAAATIAKTAKSSGIPVISYDRLISGPDVSYYISYDNAAVGKLQATSLLKQLGGGQGKSIVMINGAPTDPNAALFKSGAHSVFATSGVKIAKEYDTPDWSPDKAQSEMDQAISALGKNGFQGVYAANDGNAGAAVASMKSAGIDPTKIPSTGQDAEIAGVQRILAGQQGMTVYKAIKPEAEDAAVLAVALANKTAIPAGLVNSKQNNKTIDVPSIIFKPVAVTKDNVNSTIIKDGFWTPAQICTSAYVADCKAAGITTS